jgi:hypothetical protein
MAHEITRAVSSGNGAGNPKSRGGSKAADKSRLQSASEGFRSSEVSLDVSEHEQRQ